ncbi:DUF6207 family protein [Streptomyces sp. NRRL F-5650]|uniref:DUF6207 family protein n=1 Tax=Streptomyces sp. NRRL F-5650 TaxID=1463868 RepID=UPI002D21A968|nr:DUF6207 family protein [Streptomyces sp. NRRL F-5650]
MLWSSVALTTWIGTVTRPKLMAPDQMVRGMTNLQSPEQGQPTSDARRTQDARLRSCRDRIGGQEAGRGRSRDDATVLAVQELLAARCATAPADRTAAEPGAPGVRLCCFLDLRQEPGS